MIGIVRSGMSPQSEAHRRCSSARLQSRRIREATVPSCAIASIASRWDSQTTLAPEVSASIEPSSSIRRRRELASAQIALRSAAELRFAQKSVEVPSSWLRSTVTEETPTSQNSMLATVAAAAAAVAAADVRRPVTTFGVQLAMRLWHKMHLLHCEGGQGWSGVVRSRRGRRGSAGRTRIRRTRTGA